LVATWSGEIMVVMHRLGLNYGLLFNKAYVIFSLSGYNVLLTMKSFLRQSKIEP
jgi:hypothetical protein